MQNTDPFFKFSDVFDQENHQKLAMKIKVNETGSLLLDPDMKHPFVRIHICDFETGMYL